MVLKFICTGVICCVAFLSGCSNEGHDRCGVSGHVAFQGQPLAHGSISFIPEGAQQPAGGATIENGEYEIPQAIGLATGVYLVSITGYEEASNDSFEIPGVVTENQFLIPAEYNSETKLKAELKHGTTNRFDFDLE